MLSGLVGPIIVLFWLEDFAWYNLVGSFATALGALSSGVLAQLLQNSGVTPLDSYRAVLVGYASIGFLLLLLFVGLSPTIEVKAVTAVTPGKRTLGLHRSRGVIIKLSSLFAMDAFAGGLIVQSIVAYWFHVKYGVAPALLGSIFF
jgi:hypothetical protein